MDFAKKGAAGILSGVVEKMSFANFLPLLTRATAENDEPTPGYMLQEIARISFESPPHCQQLVEYLNRRLEKPSTAVKLKVLKIMMHLIQNGDVQFRQYLRGNDSYIKLATLYSGMPDAHLSMTPYENVRKCSQELLELLFNSECIQQDERQQQPTKNQPILGGMGSCGKYEGFGSTPMDRDGSFRSRMLNMLDRILNPTDEGTKSLLDSSPGNYRPVSVPQGSTEPPITIRSNTTFKVHVPGRAGGGWDSECELDVDREGSSVSADSLERVVPTEDDPAVEDTAVINFCKRQEWPVSPSAVRTECKSFAALNCMDVMRALATLLTSESTSVTVLRTLIVLEWFLRTDLVNPATISQQMSMPLNDIMGLSHLDDAAKIKAKKILLILNKLSAR